MSNPVYKRILRHSIGGAIVGAPTTAFAVHRNMKGRKISRKERRRILAGSGLAGALAGATIGATFSAQTAGSSVGEEFSKVRARRLENYAKKHKLYTGKHLPHMGAAAGGALGGAYGYYGTKIENAKHKKKDRSDPLGAAVLTGALGAYGGHLVGSIVRGSKMSTVEHLKKMKQYEPGKLRDYLEKRRTRRWNSRHQSDYANHRPGRGGYRPPPSGEARGANVRDVGVPSWLRGVTTKAEAKRRYRDKVRVHHPDKPTGNTRTMQDINAEWDSFSKHHFDKLGSAYSAFLRELIEIEKVRF